MSGAPTKTDKNRGSFTPKLQVKKGEFWTLDRMFNIPNVTTLKDFIDFALRLSLSEKQYTEDVLQMYHYKMCEIYDSCKCNCGGRNSPVGVRIHNQSVQHGISTKFTLKPAHYLMCEYFDTLPCNCDGYIRKSPVWDSYARKVRPEKFVDSCSGRSNFTGIINNLDKSNSISKGGEKIMQKWFIHDKNSCIDHHPNSMLTEVSMLEEFEDDIGYPQFNSSVKEESLHASVTSESVYSDGGRGDGPMLVITRRSPRKECGISFEDDEDDPSLYIGDTATNADEDSLLDVSNISRNLSYSKGDGVSSEKMSSPAHFSPDRMRRSVQSPPDTGHH